MDRGRVDPKNSSDTKKTPFGMLIPKIFPGDKKGIAAKEWQHDGLQPRSVILQKFEAMEQWNRWNRFS